MYIYIYLCVCFQYYPMGTGPEFKRHAFDIFSLSPLVAHFLRIKELRKDAGQGFVVARTQMETLPPYPFKDI